MGYRSRVQRFIWGAAPTAILPVMAICAVAILATWARAADVSHDMGKINVSELRETSGMAASRQNPDVLWLHNDGNSGEMFAVSTTGKLVAMLRCGGEVADLEDIGLGPGPEPGIDYLYLGDIGDNDSRRQEIRVIRFAEPKLTGERGRQITVSDLETFRLRYPDGPHNAEALFVDSTTGDVYLVTKEKNGARLYRVAGDQLKDRVIATLTAAGKVGVDEVSAGAISSDGRRILLRREGQGWLWNRAAGESVAAALAREPEPVPVRGKRQGPNGESISFSPAGDSYFTVSEGKKQSVYRFDLPAAARETGR